MIDITVSYCDSCESLQEEECKDMKDSEAIVDAFKGLRYSTMSFAIDIISGYQ